MMPSYFICEHAFGADMSDGKPGRCEATQIFDFLAKCKMLRFHDETRLLKLLYRHRPSSIIFSLSLTEEAAAPPSVVIIRLLSDEERRMKGLRCRIVLPP